MKSRPASLIPARVLRTVALHSQGLTRPRQDDPAPTPQTIHTLVEMIGCLQIDTLQRVRRAQYLTLWSRLGGYNPDDLDRLIYDAGQRQLFEYWRHAASIIPLSEYRWQLVHMQRMRHKPGNWWRKWLKDEDNQAVIKHVRQRITNEGALKTSDFKYEGPQRGSWWDWKPSKHALEWLFATGELMIADRVNFERVYDLTERVLPAWVNVEPPTPQENLRHHVEHAVRALGVCQPAQAAEYAYMKRGTVKPVVGDLLADGIIVGIEGVLHDGDTADLVIHRDNLPLLAKAADGEVTARRTTFLNPFDSLFWARGRDEALWGFRQVLEAYKKKEDRIWGYFCLPILHHDRLVGRFDPKLYREEGRLHLEALYLQDGVAISDELVADVAAALRGFLAFHAADELVVERSEPATFGERLKKLLAM